MPQIAVLEQDDERPSPLTSSDDELGSDHESHLSESDSEGEQRRTRGCSRISSASESEVDEFIAKTIDSLKDRMGRKQRSSPRQGVEVPGPTAAEPVASTSADGGTAQQHPPVSFERQGLTNPPQQQE